MESFYENNLANITANDIKEKIDEVSNAIMSNIPGSTISENLSVRQKEILEKYYERGVNVGEVLYKNCINLLNGLNLMVGSNDEIYQELSSGLVFIVSNCVRSSLNKINMLMITPDFKHNKALSRNLSQELQDCKVLMNYISELPVVYDLKPAVDENFHLLSVVQKKFRKKKLLFF